MRTPPPIERLVAALKRLPGIGEKSATRLAFFLLGAPEAVVEELASAIARLKQDIVLCEECFDLTDNSPCAICRDTKRDASVVCVVEEPADLAAIDRSGRHPGRYHVLGGAISPIEGIGPDQLRVKELVARLDGEGITEVIVATNASVEGEATSVFLEQEIRPLGPRVTRLARGIPVGSDLEYVDGTTIAQALAGRREM